jgi:hypothetical protein
MTIEQEIEAVLARAGITDREMDFEVARIVRLFDEIAEQVLRDGIAELFPPVAVTQ